MDDDGIRTLVTRLARPHPSVGFVAVIAWIVAVLSAGALAEAS